MPLSGIRIHDPSVRVSDEPKVLNTNDSNVSDLTIYVLVNKHVIMKYTCVDPL
jgi:hypothetical protein